MDIKTRIDELSEAEAKAALEGIISVFSMMRHIFSNDNMTLSELENHFLDMALFTQRKARK